jgi:hypothetical protein
MHTFEKNGENRSPTLANRCGALLAKACAVAASLALALLPAGCATPGPPLPPSLKLPKIVTNLTADRIGDQVVLHWTTPDETTDGLEIQGPVTAEICRDQPAVPPTQAPANSKPKPVACYAVLHRAVQPGASEATDDLSTALPSPLNAGPPRLLAYRVQLRNAAGRTAGLSANTYSISGASVAAIRELHIQATKSGALLEWRPDPAFASGNPAAESAFVDLDRTTLASSAPATPASCTQPGPDRTAKTKPLPESHLRVAIPVQAGDSGNTDPGGATDATVLVGKTYCYTAQRVRTVVAGGHTLELRSVVSSPVSVVMADIFPPDAPTGLIAVPGFLAPEANRNPGPAAAPAPPKPTIDLSWQAGTGERLAGYRVYRSELQAGQPMNPASQAPLTPSLAPTASYRDLTVEAGHTYIYRVTAVDTAGNESQPSDPATETAPTQ